MGISFIIYNWKISFTKGLDGCIIYNGIHMKTSTVPGDSYGYPDKTYLDRVMQELQIKGVC